MALISEWKPHVVRRIYATGVYWTVTNNIDWHKKTLRQRCNSNAAYKWCAERNPVSPKDQK